MSFRCKSRSQCLLMVGLLAVFLWPAGIAVAQGNAFEPEAVREFDLGLAEALSELGDGPSAIELDELARVSTRSVLVPVELETATSLSSIAVAEMWRTSEQVAAQNSGGGGSSGKAWWKKKKWWIPIVAAVVVGVASADGDGDNNLDDEED